MLRRIAFILLAASLVAACTRAPRPTASTADVSASMKNLMVKAPTQSTDETAKVCDAILDLGPSAVAHLCDALVPPGTIIDVPADKADEFEAPDGKQVNILPGLTADTQARYLLGSLAQHVARPDVGKDKRLLFTRTLIAAVEGADDDEIRAFLIRRLQYSAGDEAVPLLANLLENDRLCNPATQALEAIGTDKAGKALLKAFPGAQGERRIAIMKSLGALRVKAAAHKIGVFIDAADPVTRRTAQDAVANIGCCKHADTLKAASLVENPYERAKAMSAYLLLLERVGERGCPIGKRVSKKHLEAFLAERTEYRDVQARSKALAIFVRLRGEEAFPYVVAAADYPNKEYRMAALRLASEFEGETFTGAWIDKMDTAWPEARVEILHMLGERGDLSAFSAVTQAIADPDPVVQMEAASASVALGGADALPFLIDALATADEALISAVRSAIMRLPSDPAMASLAGSLDRLPPAGRIVALGILGARRATAQSDAVFAQAELAEDATADSTALADIRLAAVQALETVAAPGEIARLVKLLVAAKADSDLEAAAQKSIVAVANDAATPDEGAAPVVAATIEAEGAKKAVLIRTLGKIGGDQALGTVLQAYRATDDEDLHYAVAKALSEWPRAEAAKGLLDVTPEFSDSVNRVLVLQGAIRLIGEGQASDGDKVAMYDKAAGFATRSEEKRSILAGLSQLRTPEALDLAGRFLGDKALAEAAVQAIVSIALPPREGAPGLEGDAVVATLNRAREASSDEKVLERIDPYLKSLGQ